MRKLFTLLLLPAFCHITVSYAQNGKVITGKITDKTSNAVLSGVTIAVKGTTLATQSDANGEFKIKADPKQVLVIRYIGYNGQEVVIGQDENVSITLAEENTALNEVVVIGYGTAKKADLTGSIGRVESKEILKQPALNAVQSVQGKLSGVNIVASEAPGSSPTITIRGMGTALGGRNPLYVVDGFPVDNINNINSADILSIDVLKDASSASIYGLRAANGVILVTTKKGKAGVSQVSYDGYVGAKGILNRVKMANGDQYSSFVNENLETLGETWSLAKDQKYDTDWSKELIKTGMVNNHTVSFSGGSESVDYFLSYNNFKESGIVDGAQYTRNTIRNNNTYKFFDNKLKISQTLNVSFSNERTKPFSAFDLAYKQSPLVPIQYANGRYGRPLVNKTTGIVGYEKTGNESVGNLNSIGNPIFENMMQNQYNKNLYLQGGIQADYQIINDLKFTSRLGVTKFYANTRGFNDIKERWLNADPTRTEATFEAEKIKNDKSTVYANNSLNINQVETFRWVWENFLSYQKSFGKHNVDATLGNSREKVGTGNTIGSVGYDVPDKSQYWNINLASDKYAKTVTQTYYTPYTLVSYFARGQYNYDSKYYLTATVRRDGSSIFRENGKYFDIFPSLGAGWTVSNEEFMKDFSAINFLKVKANWGRLGNQNIPLNVSQVLSSPVSSNYNYVLGQSQDLVFGAASGTPVAGLTWETTEETGVGIDFGLLQNRLTGSLDYYNKLNKNAILLVKPMYTSPFEKDFYDHGAQVSNKGIELGLNWADNINQDLSYTIGFNYSYNKNTVRNVKENYDGATGGSLNNGQITKRLKNSKSIYEWYLLEADGVWQNDQEIAAGAKVGGERPGYLKYKDQNGDGIIDDRDKVYMGSYLPTYTYGINIGVNYKKWDFTASGYGVGGNKIYNALKGNRIDGGENVALATFKDRWHGEGTSNTNPGAARDNLSSSYFLESGAFFRINNLTLGYTIDKLYSSKSAIRMYVTAQNPFIFTKYTGFSPEITGSESGDPARTAGIELSAYPSTRNFIFGVNVSF